MRPKVVPKRHFAAEGTAGWFLGGVLQQEARLGGNVFLLSEAPPKNRIIKARRSPSRAEENGMGVNYYP